MDAVQAELAVAMQELQEAMGKVMQIITKSGGNPTQIMTQFLLSQMAQAGEDTPPIEFMNQLTKNNTQCMGAVTSLMEGLQHGTKP